jgi:CheY-like chemotaxis protein
MKKRRKDTKGWAWHWTRPFNRRCGGGMVSNMASIAPPVDPTLHILLIEDHADGQESMRLLLELSGYRVEVAEDGLIGIQKALANRPAVVICDIGLPYCDGYEVARHLRSSLGEGVFLIALTAYGSDQDRARAMEAGFNLHMSKPADIDQLRQMLNR